MTKRFITIDDYLIFNVDKIDSIQLLVDKIQIRIVLNGIFTIIDFDDIESAKASYKRILDLI